MGNIGISPRIEQLLFQPPPRTYDFGDRHLVWHHTSTGAPTPLFVLRPKGPEGPLSALSRCILYFHANACDCGGAYREANHLSKRLDATVICPEYPGYGLLETRGPCSAVGVESSCWAALRYAGEVLSIPPARTVLFGRSIGTGPACAMAADLSRKGTPAAALVLVAPYMSIRAVVQARVALPNSMVPDLWDNLEAVKVSESPLLIVHGVEDEVVPVEHGRTLHQTASVISKEAVFPPTWGHNTDTKQIRRIAQHAGCFLERHTAAFGDLDQEADEIDDKMFAANSKESILDGCVYHV